MCRPFFFGGGSYISLQMINIYEKTRVTTWQWLLHQECNIGLLGARILIVLWRRGSGSMAVGATDDWYHYIFTFTLEWLVVNLLSLCLLFQNNLHIKIRLAEKAIVSHFNWQLNTRWVSMHYDWLLGLLTLFPCTRAHTHALPSSATARAPFYGSINNHVLRTNHTYRACLLCVNLWGWEVSRASEL